jgi:hypothetical protein
VEHALLWVLSLADGEHDLVAMASRSGLGIDQLDRATGILEQAGLVRMLEEATRTEPSSRDPRSTARNSGGPGA